jgi:hypothetical protein
VRRLLVGLLHADRLGVALLAAVGDFVHGDNLRRGNFDPGHRLRANRARHDFAGHKARLESSQADCRPGIPVELGHSRIQIRTRGLKYGQYPFSQKNILRT